MIRKQKLKQTVKSNETNKKEKRVVVIFKDDVIKIHAERVKITSDWELSFSFMTGSRESKK
jgi:hypothetical protein